MALIQTIRKELVDFLKSVPLMQTENGRRSLLLSAGLDAILDNLSLTGSPQEFTPLLIEHLDTFGTLPDQRRALICFLEEVAAGLGRDRQETIRGFCEQLDRLPQKSWNICPYRGLFPFYEKDVELFFGRENFTHKLLETVQKTPIVSIIGPSGSGKSSVVYAGLLPELRKQNNWICAAFSPGQNPLESLADALEEIIKDLQAERYEVQQDASLLLHPHRGESSKFDKVKESLKLFRNSTLHLQDIIQQIRKLPGIQKYHILLIGDQFEEVYTLCRDKEIQTRFLQELFLNEQLEIQQQTPNFHLVFILRADFLGKALLDPYFSEVLKDSSIKQNQYHSTKLHLGSMDLQELRDVIEKPAVKAGFVIEKGLSEWILDAVLKEPGNLPLLEFTLTSLWLRRSDNVLTKSAYKDIGGVEKALARYAEERYSELQPEEKLQAQRIFVQLAQLGEGTEDTRRRVQKQELFISPQHTIIVSQVLQKLTDAKLIVTGEMLVQEERIATVEVVHEALIRHWPRLRQWINENRDAIRFQRRLNDAAKHWKRNGCPVGLLWRSPDLDMLVQFYRQYEHEITPLQQDFYHQSLKVKKEDEELKRVLWEREQKQREKALRFQSLFLADLARQENEKCDFTKGILLSLNALPKTMNAPDRPYVAEAELQLYHGVNNLCEQRVFIGHRDWVSHVAFSPDGQYIVTASRDGTACVWNTHEKGERLILPGHTGWVSHAAFSPNGSCIVTASGDYTACIWNLSGNEMVKTVLSHQGAVYHASFSSDGNLLVTAAGDGLARVWDVSNGSTILELKGHKGVVSYGCFSPDNTHIVTASFDKTVRIWDSSTGQCLSTLKGHEDWVTHAMFSPNGAWIVTASEDRTARIWDILEEKPITTLTGHQGRVLHAEFSPGATRIVTASTDNTARLWEAFTGKELAVFAAHSDEVVHATFNPQGTSVATVSRDGTAKIWDTLSKKVTCTLAGHTEDVLHASFSPNGTTIVTASRDCTARLWNISTEKKTVVLSGHKDWVYHGTFSPDAQYVVTVSFDGTARIWNTSSGEIVVILEGHEAPVSYALFNSKGTSVITCSGDGTVRVWETTTGKIQAVLSGHKGWISHIALSFNDTLVATASRDRTSRIWNMGDNTLLSILDGHTAPISSVVFSPDAAHVITASHDGTVRIWETLNGKLITTLIGHKKKILSAMMNQNGTQIVTASEDRTARVWSIDHDEVIVLTGHLAKVSSARFSPDGQYVVTASEDGTAQVWSSDNGKELLTLSGHQDAVSYATFNSDGTRIATVSSDWTARLWDAHSGKVVAVLAGHKDSVKYAEFSPNGKYVLTTSGDTTAKLWRVFPTTQELIEYANRIVPRNLSAKEGKRYFLE